MIQNIYRFYSKLIPFSVLLFVLHQGLQLIDFWPVSRDYFYCIHGFNFLSSALMYVVLAYAFQNLKDKAGFIYLALSILKMLIVMILMAVVILGEEESTLAFALQFMVVYGLYLSFEVVSMVKKLNS
ncbi:MAG: hypothetical protein P8I82_05255 [Flavobacteriales bacterium]|nr:hypothetical protein [Flavobacteriales bacterium]